MPIDCLHTLLYTKHLLIKYIMLKANVQDTEKLNQRQFSKSENCRWLSIGAYKFFASFLMSAAIEGSASSLVSAAAASTSTAPVSRVDCSA